MVPPSAGRPKISSRPPDRSTRAPSPRFSPLAVREQRLEGIAGVDGHRDQEPAARQTGVDGPRQRWELADWDAGIDIGGDHNRDAEQAPRGPNPPIGGPTLGPTLRPSDGKRDDKVIAGWLQLIGETERPRRWFRRTRYQWHQSGSAR